MTRERSGPLTWAQQEWFTDLGASEDGSSQAATNSSARFPGLRLPVATVVAALDDVLARHEGLRTLIEHQPDGQRRQTVGGGGAHDTVQVVADGAAAEAAMATANATAFRLDQRWPVAFVVMADGDEVTGIGAVVDHVAIDAWGWKVLGGDVETAVRARARGCLPFEGDPPVEQPLDSAEWESGPGGERHARRAAQFWRHQLEALRDGLGDWKPTSAAQPVAPVLHSHRLASARTATAAETLAATAGIRPSALYLLAFASAVAEVEDAAVVGIQALTANRLSRGVQASVRKAVMPAPVVVTAPTRAPFADRLTATANQQLEGFRYANFDPHQVAKLNDEILDRLQGSGAVAARFNFIDNSVVPGHLNDTSLGGENIRFTDPSIQDRVTADPPRPGGSRYILSIQHQPRGALLTLACHEDTAWSARAADMLWHIEDLMMWAADGCAGAAPRFGRDR
jgi:hypothetical protein